MSDCTEASIEETTALIVGEMAEYFDRGMLAYDDGDSYDSCPWEGEQADYWKKGWKYAEETPGA